MEPNATTSAYKNDPFRPTFCESFKVQVCTGSTNWCLSWILHVQYTYIQTFTKLVHLNCSFGLHFLLRQRPFRPPTPGVGVSLLEEASSMIVLAVEDLSSSKKFKEIVIKYCMHENISYCSLQMWLCCYNCKCPLRAHDWWMAYYM